jgi:signal transduction histidine kinase/PAS domain-containing protein
VAVYRTHFAARRPFAMDYRVRRFDGEWRWLLDHGVPRFDEDGDFVGYVGSLVDITERRQLEQQLRVMADAVPQLVWMATPDGRHDFHNGRWYAYTGMPRPGEPGASPDGWRWTEYLHPADRGRALEAWERCLRTGEPYEIEHRLRDAATGCDRWFLGRALPLRDDGGRIVRWFGTCTDIHDQRRAADAQRLLAETSRTLAASLDYEATIASVAAAMVPTLADWCAVDVLESADDGGWPPRVRRVAVAHHDPEQVAWARDLEHTTPTDWSAPSGLARVLRTGEPVFHPTIPEEFILAGATTSEQRALRRRIALHAYICVPLVARGRTLGALTLCLARPGRRYDDDDFALARELAQRSAVAIDNARLLASAATERTAAERARAEAERANLAKSQFLATMSHELRTPLNAIAGYAELLAMGIHGPVCEAQEVALARIQRSQRHLLSLINDILNFAKIEAGHVPLRIGAVPVAQNLAEIEALVAPQLRAKRLVFACGACDPALTARADAEKLRQIVLNLLSNAIKFTPPGGRIELACALAAQAADDGAAVATVGRGAPGARVELRVTDTGCGIPAEKLDAVFDPFVQLDRSFSSAGHEGTGLGLAISRDLARSMGGDLRIERSGPGTGTTFLFTLMAG